MRMSSPGLSPWNILSMDGKSVNTASLLTTPAWTSWMSFIAAPSASPACTRSFSLMSSEMEYISLSAFMSASVPLTDLYPSFAMLLPAAITRRMSESRFTISA